MKRSLPSTGVANTISFVRDAILRSSCGHMQSWKDVLPFTHSLGLTLLGAGTVGALLFLRQISPSSALSWILQSRPLRRPPEIDPSQLKVPGLRNSGNNCFLNAILQALASSDAVLSFLATYNRDNILSLFDGVEGRCVSFPLTEALLELLEELSELDPEPRIASPRHVMLALEPYAKQFDLSLQQDAAEALNYLAHALQVERIALFESWRSHRTSMTNGMVIEDGRQNESSPLSTWKRWPLEGTMGSMLVCQECGFKFSTQFESFHEVLLSPPQLSNGNIVTGCTLESCLQKYSAPECITNVSCSCCSHLLALCLLERRSELDKNLLQRIKHCTFDDDCSCERLVTQLGGSWKKVYVKAIKQLRFGRCPEVLCCQVQRVVVSSFGELVKWAGHVSFPCNLDLQPFVMSSQDCFGNHFVPPRRFNVALREIQSKLELNKPKFLSIDGSSSDDTHLSGSEDLLSDTSSESTAGRSLEEMVEQPKAESTIHWDGCSDALEAMDMKRCGLDSVSCPKSGGGYVPFVDDNDQLFSRFREVEDGISFLKSVQGTCQWHNVSVNSAFPLMTAMVNGVNQRKGRQYDEVGQNGPYTDDKWKYELLSVVVHHGSSKGGHYTVYRKAKVKMSDFTKIVDQANVHHGDVRDCDDSKWNCADLDVCMSRDKHDATLDDNVLWNTDGEALSKCTSLGSGSVALNTSRDGAANEECRCRGTSHEESIFRESQTEHVNLNSKCPSKQSSKSDEASVEQDSDGVEDQEPKWLAEDNVVLWFRVSDSNVSLVTEEEVLMAQATLLFYQQLQ